MPALENPRYELVAQFVASGKTQADAYRLAGFTAKNAAANASRLITTHPEIRERIDELVARTAKGINLEPVWVLEKLIENALAAMTEGQRGPANRALELLGKQIGMFVDKKEIRAGNLDGIPADRLEELRQLLVAAGAGSAFDGDGPVPGAKPN